MKILTIFLLMIPLIFFDRWLWLGCCSAFLLILFGWDKLAAIRKARRIPEIVLILGAVLGGACGGVLGMILFHHKSAKPLISVPVILFALAQLILLFWF